MLNLIRPNKFFYPEIMEEDFNDDLELWVEHLKSCGYINVTQGDCVIHLEDVDKDTFIRIHYGDRMDNQFEFITNDLHGYLCCREFQLGRQGYILISDDLITKVRHYSNSNEVKEYQELPLYGELQEIE